jgi:uncharacterized protein (TIGR02145 family)
MKNYILPLLLFTAFFGDSNAQTVTIGPQVWMTKNLDVATFRNGDSIPHAKTKEEWKNAGDKKQPAWCYYNNDPANGAKYGKLYNWHAVNDSRGLAPVGYHIPSDAEWTKLTDFLGGVEVAGIKMKSKSGWDKFYSQSGNGTNTSGFSGFPGGARGINGTFAYIGKHGFWWSSTEYGTDGALYCNLGYTYGFVLRGYYLQENGFSVRCVKD